MVEIVFRVLKNEFTWMQCNRAEYFLRVAMTACWNLRSWI
jgi:hypothetical protein